LGKAQQPLGITGPIADSSVRLDSERRIAGLIEKSEQFAWFHTSRMKFGALRP
jgi:hypothetical protein